MYAYISLLAFCAMLGVSFAAPAVQHAKPTSLAEFEPYTQFARAAYCSISKLSRWKCGEACSALSTFELTLLGGDGDLVQNYFVGYWPPKKTVIVAYEGTDPLALVSDATDTQIMRVPLDTVLFPGVSSKVEVHTGFRNQHALAATTILAEVERLVKAKGTQHVTVIGHSLGGALAELNALYLTLNLPSSILIKAVTYGTPRVGNPAFAQLIDKEVQDFTRINNKKDFIPIIPGIGLGYSHPHGELHILSPGEVVSCIGSDNNVDQQCQVRSVPNIIAGNLIDHLGPYEGIHIGTLFCN